jgi:hypothetical protein
VKTLTWVPLLAVLAGCNKLGFDAVSIKPIYSYAEGCAQVKVAGHGFPDEVKVAITQPDVAGVDVVVELEDPVLAKDDPAVEDPRLRELNAGFYVTGIMPAAPAGTTGYASVVVTAGDESETLEDAYYYVACPAALGYLEGYTPSSGLKTGTPVALTGCNLDAEQVRVQIVDADGQPVGEPIALVSDCRSAEVHFETPELPTGDYYLTLVDAKGNLLAGEPCSSQDSATYYCTDFPISFGGAK